MTRLSLLRFAPALLLACSAGAQSFNRPVPGPVPHYRFERYDSSYNGFYFLSPFRLGGGDTIQYAMMLDPDGYLLRYLPLKARNVHDFKYLPEKNQYSLIRYRSASDIRFQILNADFQVVESYTTTGGVQPDPHDFEASSNQTFLVPGTRDSVMDLSGFLFNGIPGSVQTHAIGFVVQEFDEDQNLLFEWDSNRHIHPSMAYGQYGYTPANFDYCHGNTVEEDSDGGLLLSFRHLNAVYKISRPGGVVEWQLGGKNSSFTFANDPGFSGQHDVRRLPNGNISLFDNANSAPPPKRSRAVEYHLDTVQWVATKVWEFYYQPPFFSFAMGGHHTTPGRYHLVNYGFCFRPNPTFVLTDSTGKMHSELLLQDSFMTYRAYAFDVPFDPSKRPAISCVQDSGNLLLSAPAGHERYEWSTGENMESISVTEPGVYQVWVSDGAGMLGSKPFFVSDVNAACPLVATHVPESVDVPRAVEFYDLSGRRVPAPGEAGLYIVRYSNGGAKVEYRMR